jgi:hypothetical protein
VPKYLTAGVFLLAGWVVLASGELYAGAPAAAALVLAAIAYAYWEKRGRPWHAWTVIVLLLPAIGSAVWIAVGGLILDTERSNEARLLYEVGPGVGLTGLLCTLVSYHGRHHPRERADEP